MSDQKAKQPADRKQSLIIWYVLAATAGVLGFQLLWGSYSQVETVPYSDFEKLLDGVRSAR